VRTYHPVPGPWNAHLRLAQNDFIGSSGDDPLNGSDATGVIQARGGSDVCIDDGSYETNGC
jgi:hypothetical protein